MQKYVFTIEKIVSKQITVYADNEENAYDIAIEKYKNGEFTLDDGNLVANQIEMEEPFPTEWIEF